MPSQAVAEACADAESILEMNQPLGRRYCVAGLSRVANRSV